MTPSCEKVVVRNLPTDQYEERPKGTVIDTLIIHSMHNPDAKDKFSALTCKECLDKHGISAHYIVDLAGTVWRTVPEAKKAWHSRSVGLHRSASCRRFRSDYAVIHRWTA